MPVDLVDERLPVVQPAAAGGEGRSPSTTTARSRWSRCGGSMPPLKLFRSALAANEIAVHALQARIGMAGVRFAGFRFGNLNTPGDLDAAGIEAPGAR